MWPVWFTTLVLSANLSAILTVQAQYVQVDDGTLVDNFHAIKDTWISAQTPDSNYGKDGVLVAGRQTYVIIEFPYPINPADCDEAILALDVIKVDGSGTLTVWEFVDELWANGGGPTLPADGATYNCAVTQVNKSACSLDWSRTFSTYVASQPMEPSETLSGLRKHGVRTTSAAGLNFVISPADEGHTVELELMDLVVTGAHQFLMSFAPASLGDALQFASLENADGSRYRPNLMYRTRKTDVKCQSDNCNPFGEPQKETMTDRNAIFIDHRWPHFFRYCFHPTHFVGAPPYYNVTVQKAIIRAAYAVLNQVLHYITIEESPQGCVPYGVDFYIISDQPDGHQEVDPKPRLIPGAAEINLGVAIAYLRGSIQHELLHFFFHHTQARPDWASWVSVGLEIKTDPIWGEEYAFFPGARALGPWDYTGVMHYRFTRRWDARSFEIKPGGVCPTWAVIMAGPAYDDMFTYPNECFGGNREGLTQTDRIATELANGAVACSRTSQCSMLGDGWKCEVSPLSKSFGFCRPVNPASTFCRSYSTGSSGGCDLGRVCDCIVPANRTFCKGVCRTGTLMSSPCTSVPIIANAVLSTVQACNSTPAGRVCVWVQCSIGFRLSGQLFCSNGPAFETVPKCIPAQPCTLLPASDYRVDVDAAKLCLPLQNSAKCADRYCKQNYQDWGPAICTGQLDGVVSLPGCIPAKACFSISDLVIAHSDAVSISRCIPLLPGKECSVACQSGYAPTGPLVCSAAGDYHFSDVPKCIAASSCTDAPAIEGIDTASIQRCLPLNSSSTCNAQCITGFTINGTLRCVDGTFDSVPTCVSGPRSCISNPNVVGADPTAVQTCLPTTFGATCTTFGCLPSLTQAGDLVCSPNGTVWTSVPVCVSNSSSVCSELPNIIGLSVTSAVCLPLAPGTSCVRPMTCLLGLEITSQPTCVGPHWATPLPTCDQYFCTDIPSIANVDESSLASCFPLLMGQLCPLTCASGFYSTSRTIECVGSTGLRTPLPTCIPAQPCTSPPTEAQAPNVPPEEWTYCLPLNAGELCTPLCYLGDSLSGSLSCSVAGSTYNEFPSCYGQSSFTGIRISQRQAAAIGEGISACHRPPCEGCENLFTTTDGLASCTCQKNCTQSLRRRLHQTSNLVNEVVRCLIGAQNTSLTLAGRAAACNTCYRLAACAGVVLASCTCALDGLNMVSVACPPCSSSSHKGLLGLLGLLGLIPLILCCCLILCVIILRIRKKTHKQAPPPLCHGARIYGAPYALATEYPAVPFPHYPTCTGAYPNAAPAGFNATPSVPFGV